MKLQDLETKTATKITIPKQSESVNAITISGTKEGIEKALHEIRTISDEQSKQAYEVLSIAKTYHPFINGPNGETAKKIIGDRPNVRINIPPLSVMKDEISIAGEKDGVLAVKEQIEKMYKDMVSVLEMTINNDLNDDPNQTFVLLTPDVNPCALILRKSNSYFWQVLHIG